MKKNIGNTDKIIRILGAVLIVILYFTNVISGTLAIILGILATLLVITSFISFCPAYLPFNLNTLNKKSNEKLS